MREDSEELVSWGRSDLDVWTYSRSISGHMHLEHQLRSPWFHCTDSSQTCKRILWSLLYAEVHVLTVEGWYGNRKHQGQGRSPELTVGPTLVQGKGRAYLAVPAKDLGFCNCHTRWVSLFLFWRGNIFKIKWLFLLLNENGKTNRKGELWLVVVGFLKLEGLLGHKVGVLRSKSVVFPLKQPSALFPLPVKPMATDSVEVPMVVTARQAQSEHHCMPSMVAGPHTWAPQLALGLNSICALTPSLQRTAWMGLTSNSHSFLKRTLLLILPWTPQFAL